jgi:acetoin utilization deacetylase AcuC-like enzyme
MAKYELIPEQLLYEGTISAENLFEPSYCSEEQIYSIHPESYWQKLKTGNLSPQEIRAMGFPLSEQLVQREWQIVSGTMQCVEFAMQYGISMNVAGGTHHAFADRAEGFCLLNDLALAAAYYLQKVPHGKVLIVDLDVHQGNGTASIFSGHPSVFTFSMHGANNYPVRKEQSSLDVGLPDGTNDAEYAALLNQHLPALLQQYQPGLILYQAGVDILQTDQLGKLAVSRHGCMQRDMCVLQAAHAAHIPLVVTMGGGYSSQMKDILEAHCNTFRLAQKIYF